MTQCVVEMPTFARRFRRNLPHKFPEWLCAMVIFGLGVLWLNFPESFDRADMASFTDIMSPQMWITTCLGVGTIRVMSIALNGENPRIGGVLRVLGALAGCALFGAFLGRALASSTTVSASLGIVIYSAFIWTDIRNVMAASADIFNSWRKVTHVAPMVR